MKQFLIYLTIAFLFSACQGGIKKSQITGTCKDSSGTPVDTHEIYGQWKKVSGYISGDRSTDELNYDYSVLMIEKGNNICQVSVVNQAAQPISSSDVESYKGTYTHNVSNRQINIQYSIKPQGATSDLANYSFSGDCSNPQLVLSYPNNSALSQEVFVLQSKNVPQNSCNGSQ